MVDGLSNNYFNEYPIKVLSSVVNNNSTEASSSIFGTTTNGFNSSVSSYDAFNSMFSGKLSSNQFAYETNGSLFSGNVSSDQFAGDLGKTNNPFYGLTAKSDLFVDTPVNNYSQSYQASSNMNIGSSATGQHIAQVARQQANSMGSTGWCLKGVRLAMEKSGAGVNLSGLGSAYKATPVLRNSSKFREITVNSPQDLKNLPAGAVVVWDAKSGHPHGHISVALGNGQEASDHVQSQITNYGSAYHVFIPVDGSSSMVA